MIRKVLQLIAVMALTTVLAAPEVALTDPSTQSPSPRQLPWKNTDNSILESLDFSEARPLQQACCKICTVGKACGDTCISKDKTCHQPPGCACNGYPRRSAMEMTPVHSTTIEAVGYGPHTRRMRIRFEQGRAYDFCGVPQHIFEGLMSAPSKGTYYNEHIRDRYPC